MRVSELFEAEAPDAKKKRSLSGGAYYSPRYDDDTKKLLGSVKDWLDTMGISKDDIQEALHQFKQTPIFKKAIAQEGFSFVPMPASEKNGTLSFETKRHYAPHQSSMYSSNNDERTKVRPFTAQYKIYANGQIRYVGKSWHGGEQMTRLNSPKPRMKAGDAPATALVKIWSASLEEVMKKWEKALDKMASQSTSKASKD